MRIIAGLLLGGIAGAVFGALFGHAFDVALVGAILGLIVAANTGSRVPVLVAPAGDTVAAAAEARIAALERRLSVIEAALASAAIAVPFDAAPSGDAASGMPSASVGDAHASALAATSSAAPTTSQDQAQRDDASRAGDASQSPAAVGASIAATLAPPVPRRPNPVWAWIQGGNTPARLGILVLLIGVGFLLKYASEHVSVPLELRLAGVAAGGIALLALGWRLRLRGRALAMILQGGGVGILYLTVFAAMRLYALLPAPAAFALLVAIVGLSALLAVLQDAMALAVAGILGGFLAPILTAGQDGSHVMLFSYYALLNAGIFAIAWFKAWRPLNLLGFVCTFVIATAWGVTKYHADDFATTEPFLVLLFLFYVGIAVLHALRRSVDMRHYVDGTLVFGTPLVVGGLQQGLMRPFEFGMALSALAASALYLALARMLWTRHRDELRLLVESFLALGVVCATLAVPLAFDARLTSAAWALEGAAIVWAGVRQRRVLARAFGIVLQLAAGVAFALGVADGSAHRLHGVVALVNSQFVGALLVATAALVSARIYQRGAGSVSPIERVLSLPAFVWGMLWWIFAGSNEIFRFVVPAQQEAALVGFATLTAIASSMGGQRLAWPMARVPALLFGPLLLSAALVAVAFGNGSMHLLHDAGVVAWPLAIGFNGLLLWRFERDGALPGGPRALALAHAVLLWLVTVVVAQELAWLASRELPAWGVWAQIPWGLVPSIALGGSLALAARGAWPCGAHRRAYAVIGAIPLALWMLAWSLCSGIGNAGDPAPLPYVPIVNPLDLTLGLVAVTLARWSRGLRADGIDLRAWLPAAVLVGVPSALIFLWINAIALRTLHHWFGIEWAFEAMWRSMPVQATLSLLWTLVALAVMAIAARRAARGGWTTGAVLLGIVVVKLFVVDLSHVGGIERIVSFIGVGLLLLLIGYLAPVPPPRKEDSA